MSDAAAPALLPPTSAAEVRGATGRGSAARRPRRSGAARLLLVCIALLVVAAAVALAAGWLMSRPAVRDFIATYPGSSPLPDGSPVGLPGWLAWQHFLNSLIIVLIIRTGLQVRREQRPAVFWTSRRRGGSRRKISITLWLHQGLDLLWVTNGVVFVVLLVVTGQWVRLVPTTWEVVPNALSAALQYASLRWPTEDGWVNYNSLQVLAYFVTTFVAAPLAIVTGVRMSALWPTRAVRASRIYPVELARAVHFPVMLYFVVFIVVHVSLVLATGALRNLNHMYGGQDAVNWVGLGVFCLSLLVIAGVWAAARPVVVAPIARLFGTLGR